MDEKELVIDTKKFFNVHTIAEANKLFLTKEIKKLWLNYFNEWQYILANSITCPICRKNTLTQKYRYILKETLKKKDKCHNL